jgi:hypothetical protein
MYERAVSTKCRIWGSHDGRCGEFCLLGYNTVPLRVNQCFGGKCHFHLQGRLVSQESSMEQVPSRELDQALPPTLHFNILLKNNFYFGTNIWYISFFLKNLYILQKSRVGVYEQLSLYRNRSRAGWPGSDFRQQKEIFLSSSVSRPGLWPTPFPM